MLDFQIFFIVGYLEIVDYCTVNYGWIGDENIVLERFSGALPIRHLIVMQLNGAIHKLRLQARGREEILKSI